MLACGEQVGGLIGIQPDGFLRKLNQAKNPGIPLAEKRKQGGLQVLENEELLASFSGACTWGSCVGTERLTI